MTLSADEREAIVRYRMEKAQSTLIEAEAVAELGFWSLCANRLYYSAYYGCVALLIANGHDASTHSGVLTLISRYFVKESIISQEEGRLLRELFMMRQSGDYDDMFDWAEEDIKTLIPKVINFIDKILGLLKLT